MANFPNKVRAAGSGYTTIGVHFPTSFGVGSGFFEIAFCQQLSVTSPSPVAQPAVIQPLNKERPVEIVSPRAVGHGQISLQVIELWNRPVWDHLVGFTGLNDLRAILSVVADRDDQINIQTHISPPKNMGSPYSITYYGCVVADIRDDEQIDVTTMQINKQVDFWFRFSHISGREAGDVDSYRGAGVDKTDFSGFN